MSKTPLVILLCRKHCPPCEDAKRVLASVAQKGLCRFEVKDVDRDPGLRRKYGNDVPVLLLHDRVLLQHRITEAELSRALQEVGG